MAWNVVCLVGMEQNGNVTVFIPPTVYKLLGICIYSY